MSMYLAYYQVNRKLLFFSTICIHSLIVNILNNSDNAISKFVLLTLVVQYILPCFERIYLRN